MNVVGLTFEEWFYATEVEYVREDYWHYVNAVGSFTAELTNDPGAIIQYTGRIPQLVASGVIE